jgi:hypothetical protein
MSSSTRVVVWFASVLAALLVGWLTGVSNATRVAAGATHFMFYLFAIVVIALAIGGAWALMHDRRDMNDKLDRRI